MVIRITALVLLLVSSPTAALSAQQADSARAPGPSQSAFFTGYDALLAAGFVAGTVALLPLDRQLASDFRRPVNQASPILHDAASFFNFLGDPGAAIVAPSLYVVGRVGHWPHVAKLGLHTTEAVFLAGTLTSAIKLAAGRARPYVSADSLPDSYAFLRGFKGNQYQSFPSGHTTAAFSFAAAVTAESSHWLDESRAWPGWKLLVGTTMYGGATAVGLARMYDDRHWASDVLAAAAIGTFSGIKVVRYGYRHPANRIERWLLSAQPWPAADGGTALRWWVPAPF